MTKVKVLGLTVAMLTLTATNTAVAMAASASQTEDQYDTEYCTWQITGPIVQGEPLKWECVTPGTVVPL